MDDEFFDEAMAKALGHREIRAALDRLSEGRADRRRELTERLTGHVRDAWPGMSALVTSEADAYAAALAATSSSSSDPEELPRAPARVRPERDARTALVLALVERAVLPAIRQWINEELELDRRRRYRLRFDTADTSGLRQMSAPEHELATDAFSRLRGLMTTIGGGAIGISGPRGVGKSTLIRSACGDTAWFGKSRESRPSFGVFVPAPVEYVPREFLLHVFASLCLRVDPSAERPDVPVRPPSVPPLFVAAGGLLSGVAGLVLLAVALMAPQPGGVLVAGFALVAAVAGGLAVLRRRLGIPHFTIAIRGTKAAEAAQSIESRAAYVVIALAIAATGLSLAGWVSGAVPGVHTYLALGGVAVGVLVALCAVDGALASAAYAGVAGSAGLVVATAVVAGPPTAARRLAVVLFVVAAVAAWARRSVRHLAPSPRTGHALLAGLTAGALGALAGGLAATAAAAWNVPFRPGYAWAAVLLASSFGIATAQSAHPRTSYPAADGPEHVRRARTELRRIRYQQTVTTGWSDAVKLGAVPKTPIALERTVTGGTALARVPLAYPEIVAAFHAYVAALTRSGAAVVIGIDELDKLPPEAAVRFMNEVKAIFDAHVPGCYFLVSISEEALAGFEQRGLPTRDVFDTAFDEMLRLEHLSYQSTVDMLAKRVIDLPRGVAVLAHALAGGLPRDVIRSVRSAVAIRHARGTIGPDLISELARQVCADELRGRLHGLRTEARALGDWRLTVALTDWADQRTLNDVTDLGTLPKEVGDTDLLLAHATSVYHLATVAGFFATATEADLARVEVDGVETLARARADMAVSWALAWRGVSAFRLAWGLPVVEPPAG